MAKNKITEVQVNDEGIIIIDELIADYSVLYNLIKTKSCRIYMKNKSCYRCLLVPFRYWLRDNVSEDDVVEVVSYIKSEWQKDLEIINMFIE